MLTGLSASYQRKRILEHAPKLSKRGCLAESASASGTREAPYPYSKMCELCELCELFVKKLLSKTECAILTDCALFTLWAKYSMLRAHSMSSRGSKSFRFLQIISAANKQYAGARAPDRQQAAALTAWIPLRCFAASLLLLLRCILCRHLYSASPLRCFRCILSGSCL